MKTHKSKSLTVMLLSAVILGAVTLGAMSCKAWRTVTTTATCVQSADSTKTTTTISTKTEEVYQGAKKK